MLLRKKVKKRIECIVDELRKHGCITAKLARQRCGIGESNASYHFTILERLYEVEYIRKLWGTTIGVVCVPGVVPRREANVFCRYITSVRSKTAFITFPKMKLIAQTTPIERSLYAVVIYRAGAEVVKYRYCDRRRQVAIVDVARARDFCNSLHYVDDNYEVRPREDLYKAMKKVSNTQIITVTLDRQMIERMDELVAMGYYESRSEIIRTAIKLLIEKYK